MMYALRSDAEPETLNDMRQIVAWGMVATPGLVVCAGRVPPTSEVMSWLVNVLAEEDEGP